MYLHLSVKRIPRVVVGVALTTGLLIHLGGNYFQRKVKDVDEKLLSQAPVVISKPLDANGKILTTWKSRKLETKVKRMLKSPYKDEVDTKSKSGKGSKMPRVECIPIAGTSVPTEEGKGSPKGSKHNIRMKSLGIMGGIDSKSKSSKEKLIRQLMTAKVKDNIFSDDDDDWRVELVELPVDDWEYLPRVAAIPPPQSDSPNSKGKSSSHSSERESPKSKGTGSSSAPVCLVASELLFG